MTTIAEEKQNRLEDIQSQPINLARRRLSIIKAIQLANEMKLAKGQGLSNPYPVLALFYGHQRAMLRGLSATDVMNYDFPSESEWNLPTSFTYPSATQFGYIFYDMDENEADIDDPRLYYLTKKKSNNEFSTEQNDVAAFNSPVSLPAYRQNIAISDGERLNFQFDLNIEAVPGSVKIFHDADQVATDDGNGALTGATIDVSTIDYSGPVDLNYLTAADNGATILIEYDAFTNVDTFDENYEQVDFTLSTKSYSGQVLKLINFAPGVLSGYPMFLQTAYLRRKTDHQKVGFIQVVCEGLEINSGWDFLTGDPEDTLKITHDQFKALLGYVDPDIDNDLIKSANSYLVSTGRKDGASYPDIEESPFFPETEGNHIGSSIFTGNHVHSEEGVPKWAVHSDIKWAFGTAPVSLGQTDQNNPDTFLAALNAINNFSSAADNPVPAETTGSNGSTYYEYAMSNGFVTETTYTWGGGTYPTGSYSGSTSEYGCYYNDIQHLKDDHLDHLLGQLDKIVALGDQLNSIEVGRQVTDNQFFSDTTTFLAALNTFLTYHNGFDPIAGRPTYAVSQVASLISASTIYLVSFNDRVTDLDTVIGTPASGYSKIIYDSCNSAVKKDTGYLREVIDDLNSIQDIYGMISKKQSEYTDYP